MVTDMTTRREFLTGLAASGMLPATSWAAAGAPEYLAAGLWPDGAYRLAGLRASGQVTFVLDLPGRGHAAAAHPTRAQAVAFARRPGRFALVLDCVSGAVLARLDAPEGRHFYGHGAFSRDGRTLFTTENDYEAGQGVIGMWNAERDYARLGEFASGGVGPHDMLVMPDGGVLAVANGGIETHPDSGRAKLNLPFMEPNLSYLAPGGTVLEQVALPRALRRNSIRHLALRKDGLLAFAMQWQDDPAQEVPLLALHRRGQEPRLLSAPYDQPGTLAGYAGSVAFSADGAQVAITSPRGGVMDLFDAETGTFVTRHQIEDVCGLGPGSDAGLFFTTGTGQTGLVRGPQPQRRQKFDMKWDNHLVAINAGA